MGRRFYCFNNLEEVKQHISQVKTMQDLRQIEYDIEQSETNLVHFMRGVGVFAVDCSAGNAPFRHVFLTQEVFDRVGEAVVKEECDSYTILEAIGDVPQTGN